MKYEIIDDGDQRIFLDRTTLEAIALRQAADCLSWQEQKARFLKAQKWLTLGFTDEIHFFRKEVYEFLRRNGIDENKVWRYMK